MTIETAYQALVFQAMNTEVEVLIYPASPTGPGGTGTFDQKAKAAAGRVKLLFEVTEASLSRFRPESELSRLNRQGHLEEASTLLYNSVSLALDMVRRTKGIFDPTILTALENAGYNRSFELLGQPGLTTQPGYTFPALNGYRGVEIEPDRRNIRLPFATRLDLGGIAKGMTVDRAAALLRKDGFQNFMVSAGGDLYLGGSEPGYSTGWGVQVQNPLAQADNLIQLRVNNGGVATSAITKRRWFKEGKPQNHLIDPRTGQPVDNGVASVTVTAPSTTLADVLAKTALILGSCDGYKLIEQQPGCAALFCDLNGSIIRTARLPQEH